MPRCVHCQQKKNKTVKKEPKWQRHCDKCNEWYRIVDGEWETIYTTRNPNKKENKK